MHYGHMVGLDKPVSRLIQGLVTLRAETQADDDRFLDAIWEMGCNTFDTAHIYGQGESERALGRWLNTRGVRGQAVIITKGVHPKQAGQARVTPEAIAQDLNESLERLQVDSVDLYLLHRDDPQVPVGPIVEALTAQQQAGRISVFGGSNWTYQRVREANAYAREHGLTPFGITSPNFSLAEQIIPPWDGCHSISGPAGQEARTWYADQKLPVLAWSSLAGGFFSGRFRRNNLDTFTDNLDVLCVKSYCVESNFAKLDRAEALARAKGVSLTQIALAYVLQQPFDLFALVGSRTAAEFRANLEATNISLTAAEMSWLEQG